MIFRVLRSFATHRENLTSKYVSEVMKMNVKKFKDCFVNHRPNNKKLLQFMHRCYDLREMPKTQFLRESCGTYGQLDWIYCVLHIIRFPTIPISAQKSSGKASKSPSKLSLRFCNFFVVFLVTNLKLVLWTNGKVFVTTERFCFFKTSLYTKASPSFVKICVVREISPSLSPMFA